MSLLMNNSFSSFCLLISTILLAVSDFAQNTPLAKDILTFHSYTYWYKVQQKTMLDYFRTKQLSDDLLNNLTYEKNLNKASFSANFR